MGAMRAIDAEDKDGELRRKLIRGIDYLTREQMDALVHLIDSIAAQPSSHQRAAISDELEYDEALDPAVGLISGPTDFSSRGEDILSQEIREHSGWTVKEPTNGGRR
jgi:hypothetical protein